MFLHNIRHGIVAMGSLALMCAAPAAWAAPSPRSGAQSLVFDPSRFSSRSSKVEGKTITYRAYEGIVYVKYPVDARYQSMNVYIPTEYYEGKSIGSYNAETAPIFFCNSVGGYMPGPAGNPERGFDGQMSAALVALSKGYVVAAPGARGRTSTDASGHYTGKAPADIVDLKAAVRYLRANDHLMPGTAEKIISNGTSAGGALSALLGATGNHPDYEPYLKALGAAESRDDVFAVSAYCPITDLDHADMAYEWMFCGLNDYLYRPRFMGRPPMPAPFPPEAQHGQEGQRPPLPLAGRRTMSADQVRISKLLKAQFPAYLNSLGLRDRNGAALTLDADGNGPFRDHIKSLVIASAQRALKSGQDFSGLAWIKIQSGTVVDIDFDAYLRFAGRMKPTPAFDGLDLGTGENGLFGTSTIDARHFTRFGQDHSAVRGSLAKADIVRLMNPMDYIGAKGAVTARYWRIRQGAIDRDTSLAIPAILAKRLESSGCAVDFSVPWGQGHWGDYDLDELFRWMEQICR